MAYLPKSKYQQLYTNGNEFINTVTGKIYIGPYLKLSGDRYFIGENISLLGDPLKILNPSSEKIPNTSSNAFYKFLNPKYTKKEINYVTPVSTKVFPNDKDYIRGYMIRYFGIKIQTGTYFEVDQTTYKDILEGNIIDNSLYSFGQITWALKGDVEKINGTNILRFETKYPGLRKLFINLSEFGSL